MTVLLREAQQSDIPFLQRMHYEAVFWRAGPGRPSFEEALAHPELSNAVADWGERDGDTAVIATVDSSPVGAACYRYWTKSNFINGYLDDRTPVLVIGVHDDYRRQGIGTLMIEWLIDRASRQAIQQLSLNVAKDNHALNLYRQQGFLEHTDNGNALLMVRKLRV